MKALSFKLLFCCVLTLFVSAPLTLSQTRYSGSEFSMRSPVFARNGVVSTSHPLASQIGLQVLKDGGNAIDAAIAANAALGLMEPTGCGIGGDLFALVWIAEEGKLYGLNASGRAGLESTLERFAKDGLDSVPTQGALAVTVPGAVDGWFMLHDKFGSQPMTDLLAPAIEYAREGFVLTTQIGASMKRTLEYFEGEGYPNLRATYQIDGQWPAPGTLFRNPMLAKSYELIAKQGRSAFYEGPIAEAIVTAVQDQGGHLTSQDFKAHHGDWVEPVSTDYRGYELWEIPPNGQGIAALQMLNILETYDFSTIPFGSKEHIHLFTEAKKLVFEDRAKYYADPEFADVPLEILISKDYARDRARLINPERAGQFEAGDAPSRGDTIYLATADKDGNMVSLIQSNFWGMGSGVVPKDTGFMLQNRGAAFSLQADHNNRLEPGKRPFHTIIPAFVTKQGKPFFSYGVMGGYMQPQGHVQVLMNIVDFGMDPQEAGDAPRIIHDGSSTPEGVAADGTGTLYLESGFSPVVVRDLMRMRHEVGSERFYGGYQGVMWNQEGGYYIGATESRFEGASVGY
ncbi:MAG: gamma-glutamyltransferase [Pseudomonadota bacterium]